MKNSPTKILIVDDEPDIVEILKYNLNNEGYDVKSANNGLKAIEKAKKFIPDIILLDVMMPEMDGIEACLELKKINSLSNTRIIFLSARGEDFTQIAAFDEIKIDKESYLVSINKEDISLPRKEFELLYLIASKPGKVFSRDEIMTKVWGTQVIVGDRTIDVHVRKLREKIGEKYIKTIKGVGYKFKLNVKKK
jgi:two-component system alkaline phosphatase synthesis response regulator PhoP